jgi:hypothetical protein
MKLPFARAVLVVALTALPLHLHAAEWKRPAQVPTNQVRVGSERVRPEFTDSIRKNGRTLYKTLKGMKKEQDFIKSGYGNSPNKTRYQAWDADATALHTECSAELQKLNVADRIQSDLFDVCVATTNLSQLGLHYAMNGSVDDRSTQMWQSAIKSAFKIK